LNLNKNCVDTLYQRYEVVFQVKALRKLSDATATHTNSYHGFRQQLKLRWVQVSNAVVKPLKNAVDKQCASDEVEATSQWMNSKCNRWLSRFPTSDHTETKCGEKNGNLSFEQKHVKTICSTKIFVETFFALTFLFTYNSHWIAAHTKHR